MSTTSEASARIVLGESPKASPGHCALCGKNEHPKGFALIDNFDFEFYGSVIFCADCAGAIARPFGYIATEDADTLIARVDHLEARDQAHRDAILHLEAAVDNLANFRSVLDSAADDNERHELRASDASEATLEVTSEPVTAGEGEGGDVNEPVTEQGPSDVPNSGTDELLKDLGL